MAVTAAARMDWGRTRLEKLRSRLTTTPGRLRFVGAVLATAAVVFGAVAVAASTTRSHAVDAVGNQAEPLMVDAAGLYASLSDADATAATTFVTGGLEPAARRRRYLAELHSATVQLSRISQEVESSPAARRAAKTISTRLPLYTGMIETARANNRQGLPVGAAYLRRASTLMREEILPAAAQLYAIEAARLDRDYRSGVSTGTLLAFALAGAVMLGLLAATQFRLTRLTNRIFNVPLLAATVIVAGLSAWVLISFVTEQNSLSRAQRDGSDSVQVLSAARILALRAQADESLALVARGGGQENLDDFKREARLLGGASGASGLLGEAKAIARRRDSEIAIDRLSRTLRRYLAVHRHVASLEANGQFRDAARVAVGTGSREVPLSDALNSGLRAQIVAAQGRFRAAVDDASAALSAEWLAIPLLVAAGALLALYGLWLRINEYR